MSSTACHSTRLGKSHTKLMGESFGSGPVTSGIGISDPGKCLSVVLFPLISWSSSNLNHLPIEVLVLVIQTSILVILMLEVTVGRVERAASYWSLKYWLRKK